MDLNILGAILSALAGALTALVNYLISKAVLKNAPHKLFITTVLHQVLNVTVLAGVYFISRASDIRLVCTLTSAAVGLTVPMLYFTRRLLSLNEALNKKENGKGEDNNG